ncbi:uncharacterized protein LOC123675610 isoform X2 [Harmonia axyridis]|uniref:uncharacterized protein LOC123675610 isoform X2 n=1 Tax=Harmonia axyridis TaxID=115357 RepID=UPI001E279A7D|nr:uncharacterized protein LOC123675610 isoform X2 [Harmonia axyridis]
MALNLYRKINATIAKNCKRFLQNNAQKLTQVSNILEENQVQKEVDKNKFNKFSISSHERTTPSENPRLWANAFEPERDMIQRSLQNRYLQPATMPTYRDEPIFDTNFMASLQEEPIKKAKNIVLNNSASQQILESFKKKQAQNLPTRKPRLTSNPFPEPLKAIFSPYTISDQEKADQMLLDQKSMQMNLINSTGNSQLTSNHDAIKSSKKFYCTMTQREKSQDILDRVMGISSLHSKEFLSLSSDQVRCFSSKSGGNEVCKDSTKPKMKSCLPRKCNKITIKGCPPVRRNTICKQKNKEVHCKKIDAPYPSYSESCYMEPRARKTECDLCPWTEKNNPNFKGKLKIPPKFYHTDCMSSSAATTNGGFSVKNFPDQDALKNFSQRWMHKANLSQVYIKGKKMPTMDCFESVKKPITRRWLFNVTKDSNIVEQNSKNEVRGSNAH